MRVHLVYPEMPGNLAAPWCIGNRLRLAFEARGLEVVHHDWDRSLGIPPDKGDVVIGHPYPYGDGAFLQMAPWIDGGRVVALFPWAQRDARGADMTNWVDLWVGNVDAMLPICGPYWRKQLPIEWAARPLDLAIDPADFPPLDPCAPLTMLHVGCALPAKGADYLQDVARLCARASFGTLGDPLPGFWNHGRHPLQGAHARHIVAGYGCFVACGINDANPMTMLEAVALGRLAICTPTSGWGDDLCIHIPNDDPMAAAAKLDEISMLSWADYDALRAKQREAMGKYTWERFTSAVVSAALGESR